jgi:hypothetical protein
MFNGYQAVAGKPNLAGDDATIVKVAADVTEDLE